MPSIFNMNIKKNKILNFKISILTIEMLVNEIKYILKVKKKSYICISAVHGSVESIFNKKYRLAHDNALIATADGKPIYWALKLLGNKNVNHLPGYLVTDEICKIANHYNYNIGVYGSTNDVLNKFVKNLKKKYKKIKFTYLFSPPFRKLTLNEIKDIQTKINKSNIDILFVALGAPKQEIWMHDNYKKINCLSVGIGAAIDFISGNKNMAPKFMEYLGLAWLFRLISEPRRLFMRYFITNTLFIYFFSIQYIKFKLKINYGQK